MSPASDTPLQRARSWPSLARGAFGFLLMAVVVGAVLVLVVPGVLGLHRYVITGGSMEPTVPRGSLVYAEEVPVRSLRQGDVITYVPPGDPRPVTHRIVRVLRDTSGVPAFRTQGDANATPDRAVVKLDRPTQARMRAHVPFVGWPLIALSSPQTRLLLLGLPALLAAFLSLRALWREGGELLDAERGGAGVPEAQEA